MVTLKKCLEGILGSGNPFRGNGLFRFLEALFFQSAIDQLVVGGREGELEIGIVIFDGYFLLAIVHVTDPPQNDTILNNGRKGTR